MNESLTILVVDDDEAGREFLTEMLKAMDYRVETASGGHEALKRLERDPKPNAIMLDVLMPEPDGVETLKRYRASGGPVPVIMCSALDEAETVVRAMRAGASDYVTKPFNHEELAEILDRVVGAGRPRTVPSTQRTSATNLGSSPAMLRVDELVDRIADADVPVLITGESGVGKDVVAREIHARSARASKVFVKINCAALPAELLESELFGHERGSFTGAEKTKQGQFELADGGTLFLDEIGEIPVALQAKLLQVLQDGEFYRVGGQKKIKVDARVIVATNVNLPKAIAEGKFREDLYYRLNVIQIAIPPLRERREEIPRLVKIFVEKYGKRYGRNISDVPPEVMTRFATYAFPGNIRELENLVRRLIVLRDSQYILSELDGAKEASPQPESIAYASPTVVPVGTGTTNFSTPLASPISSAAAASPFNLPSPLEPIVIPPPPAFSSVSADGSRRSDDYRIDLKDLGRRAANVAEREAIVVMLGYTGGDKKEAADRLGISYKAILYKIREFQVGRARLGANHVVEAQTEAEPDLTAVASQ